MRIKINVAFVQQPQFDKRQMTQALGGALIAFHPLAADLVDHLHRVEREFAQALSF
ncbi:MAG: hypothetical protein N838_07625 [Thiohalocapsa sp. PB-PSB1]|nr:MAG: hypothetical protein N838_08245 [Thiohalocapsa sp. PB-PSB1]QQO53253.1 MAG: hypothetical protein N838_07625 [Thiohalocapsa sp. PB-PSB1]